MFTESFDGFADNFVVIKYQHVIQIPDPNSEFLTTIESIKQMIAQNPVEIRWVLSPESLDARRSLAEYAIVNREIKRMTVEDLELVKTTISAVIDSKQ